jgi:hypothetical protein
MLSDPLSQLAAVIENLPPETTGIADYLCAMLTQRSVRGVAIAAGRTLAADRNTTATTTAAITRGAGSSRRATGGIAAGRSRACGSWRAR